ncbi:trigger factor [Pseudogracilibacillus auburnensis]|uniref:Trigger factor n=1 Tax=Pseudogracilibacillus auburnensis TaxID=1494959 RepID=A0A2V3WCZ6_9BACI|nr:trigger factor [Pseudogracilibacillus auburnensis]MBO1002627.1 trigger factor [Pseudogracilibacillus auburnensis]PXW86649.1 trigger factor [Pseudogracilibacillus auburnensis]
MSVTAKWEKKEGNEGVLTINVSSDEFNQALDKAFKKVVKDVSLPGFRKGRIPRPIFEKRFGVESLYQDAVDIILPKAYGEAIDQTEIFPVDQPNIDIEEIERGKDLVFTCEVTVKPEVKLGEYKGLEVEEESVEVTDEDVENELKALQESQAELVLKEEGSIEEGNTVVIDFEGFLEDEAFEGGKGENHPLEIGSGQFIPGFEEQLIGKEAGEEPEISVTFPADYHAEDLAGKEALFKVKIHEVKEKELPELDDEFAKDVDEDVETLEELKAKKKEELQKEKEQTAENNKREQLIEQVTDKAEVDIPEAMIDTELDQMMKEFEQRLQMQGMNLENYFQFSGQSEDELKEQMKNDAEKRVKTNLTLEAILDAEEIEVSEEDIDAELTEMAKLYKLEKDQIVGMLGGNSDVLKEDLKIKKAINYIVEQSKAV